MPDCCIEHSRNRNIDTLVDHHFDALSALGLQRQMKVFTLDPVGDFVCQ